MNDAAPPGNTPPGNTPAVSVLMCAYNAERYVAATVRSVLGQTLRELEFVAVDDGSTDRTAEVLRGFAAGDDRMRVVSGPNVGIPRAANVGLRACRGELVARIDADDLAEPDRLARQVAFMAEHPEVVASGTSVTFIDEADRRLTINRPPTDHEAIDDALMRGHCAIWNTSCVIRRGPFLSIDGYDEHFATAEDVDAWLRLAEVGRLANLDAPLHRYRLHDASVSAADQTGNRALCREACERAAERRGVACRFEADEPWRPGADAGSRSAFYTRYGWWAHRLGEMATARHYARRAIRHGGFAAEPWVLLAKSLRATRPTAGETS
ncbi:MAG: glycosyltransferase family A protein [Planctomycetota bacterium]